MLLFNERVVELEVQRYRDRKGAGGCVELPYLGTYCFFESQFSPYSSPIYRFLCKYRSKDEKHYFLARETIRAISVVYFTAVFSSSKTTKEIRVVSKVAMVRLFHKEGFVNCDNTQ